MCKRPILITPDHDEAIQVHKCIAGWVPLSPISPSSIIMALHPATPCLQTGQSTSGASRYGIQPRRATANSSTPPIFTENG
jgi:hypothetical protein